MTSRADARIIERPSARRVTSPPRIEDELAETADHAGDDSQREDRLTFLLPSCEPDPRVLSLPERRLLPPESKDLIRDVLERQHDTSPALPRR